MIDILMAVYNGADFVAEQIDSILQQSEKDWRLIIQDDCSTDATMGILEKYAAQYSEKIVLKRRTFNSGAADSNFFSMLPYAENEYIMFCDHDDVWLPDKLEKTLHKMHELERDAKGKPLLVHTDLKVVNGSLQVMADSMFRLQNLDSSGTDMRRLLVQNIVTGCTMMVNKTLLQMVGSPPRHAVMHDWWFALIASCFGTIGFVEEATILYRQHGKNEVGAKNVKSFAYNVSRLKDANGAQAVLCGTYTQAEEFRTRYFDKMDADTQRLLNAYCSIPALPKLKRVGVLCRYGFWKCGFLRRAGQLLFV